MLGKKHQDFSFSPLERKAQNENFPKSIHFLCYLNLLYLNRYHLLQLGALVKTEGSLDVIKTPSFIHNKLPTKKHKQFEPAVHVVSYDRVERFKYSRALRGEY